LRREINTFCAKELHFFVIRRRFFGKLHPDMSTISTHILDTSRGTPASGVAVSLEMQNTDESWTELSHAWTDTDGRVKPFFLVDRPVSNGTYRLVFDTEPYFSSLSAGCFYPQVSIVFNVDDASQHYHVPLLISPYGYSTYRGS